MKQFKEMEDEKRMENIELLARKNIEEKDDIIMDFEVDIEKMIKKISVRELLKNNKEHMKRFKNNVMRLERQVYIKDNVKSGISQAKRFNGLFVKEVV